MAKYKTKNLPFGNQRHTKNELNMAIRNFVFTHPKFYNQKYSDLSPELKRARNQAKKNLIKI